MGCQPTRCRQCGGNFPACQLKNGLCPTCTSAAIKQEQIKQNAGPKTY